MHTLTQQSGCLATGYYRLPQCCQLLADFSGQFGRKIRPLRKQIGPIAISPFWRRFLPLETKLSLFVSPVGKVKFQGRRVGKQTFQKFGLFLPFLHNVCRNSGPKFSGHTTFYSASFEVSGRIFGQLATLGSQLAAVQCSAEWIRTSYSGIWPTAATCVCSVKKRKEIFLSGIRTKCSALLSYSIKKEAYMKDLRKLYTLKKLNFKAPQNGQNWNLISGMCFTMEFLIMILT